MSIVMYDTITVDTVPANPPAVAGYINGSWPTYNGLVQRFPNAHHLSIAVSSGADADCLDVEPQDATNSTAQGWTRRQLSRGLQRPCLYTSISNATALLASLAQVGVTRDEIRLWTAHYTFRPHICDPSCGFGQVHADATQWTDRALGRNLDESLCLDDFFGPPPPPPDPHHYGWFYTVPINGKQVDEAAIVREYDQLRRRPFIHRPRLRMLRDAQAQLAGRILTVMEETGDTKSYRREWRYHQLYNRAQGQRLV